MIIAPPSSISRLYSGHLTLPMDSNGVCAALALGSTGGAQDFESATFRFPTLAGEAPQIQDVSFDPLLGKGTAAWPIKLGLATAELDMSTRKGLISATR